MNSDLFWILSFLGICVVNVWTILFFYFRKALSRNEVKSLVIFLLIMTVWSFFRILFGLAPTKELALVFARIAYIGTIFIPPAFLYAVYSYLGKKNKKIIFLVLMTSVFFVSFVFSNLFIRDMNPKMGFKFYDEPGFLFLFFNIYYSLCAVLGFGNLFLGLTEFKGRRKNQIKYLITGYLIGFIGSGTTFPLVFNIPLYPFGIIFILFYPIIAGYAMAKEQIFDIDLAFYHIFIWTFSLGTAFLLFLPCLFLPRLFLPSILLQVIVAAVLAAATVGLFPIYFKKYEDWSNDKILHHAYDFIKLLPERAKEWTKYLDLDKLLEVVFRDFTEVMKAGKIKILLTGDWVFGSHDAARYFYEIALAEAPVSAPSGGPASDRASRAEEPDRARRPEAEGLLKEKSFVRPELTTKGEKQNCKPLVSEDNPKLPKDNELLLYAGFQEGVIYLEDLKKDLGNPHLSKEVKDKIGLVIEEMQKLDSQLVLAVMYEDKYLSYLIGLICLGGLSEKMIDFMKERIAKKFLSQVAAETGAAFQHSLKSRKMEIVDEKKGHFLDETLRQVQKPEILWRYWVKKIPIINLQGQPLPPF